MYTDFLNEPDRVQKPSEVVGGKAARDCVRLAGDCLTFAMRHLTTATPISFTRAHDQFFTMKSAKVQALLSNEDFWWYLIARLEAGEQDIAEAVLGYEREHVKTGTMFRKLE